MFKRLISYFYPIKEFEKYSETTRQTLEINWNNGRLVMDSATANYSYGSLQRILRIGLLEVGFDRIRSMTNILVLGVAGGSVLKTLVNEIKFTGKITGVEIDPVAIDLAEKYFDIKPSAYLEIVQANAELFVAQSKIQYDLVIIDIFNDTEMPAFLFEKKFVDHISKTISPKGAMIFNTMVFTIKHRERNGEISKFFRDNGIEIKALSNLEGCNELLIGKRIS